MDLFSVFQFGFCLLKSAARQNSTTTGHCRNKKCCWESTIWAKFLVFHGLLSLNNCLVPSYFPLTQSLQMPKARGLSCSLDCIWEFLGSLPFGLDVSGCHGMCQGWGQKQCLAAYREIFNGVWSNVQYRTASHAGGWYTGKRLRRAMRTDSHLVEEEGKHTHSPRWSQKVSGLSPAIQFQILQLWRDYVSLSPCQRYFPHIHMPSCLGEDPFLSCPKL